MLDINNAVMLDINIGIGVVVFGIALWAKFHTEWRRAHQKFVGALILVYGCYLALLTGSYTTFTIPGIGSIAVGSGVGAGIGLGAWAVLGTVGVATGGTAIAVGAIGMVAIGALFGGAGGAASNFGFHEVSYPLVSPIFWLPVLLVGVLLIIGARRKKEDKNELTEM